MKAHTRFECVANGDGTWKVWDNSRDRPASLGGQLLVNRQKFRAETACDILNRIHARVLRSAKARIGK